MKRREFLEYAARGAIAAGAVGFYPITYASASSISLDSIIPGQDIVRLPARGTAYIVNDFHASFSDYESFVKSTDFFKRILYGEDLYLIINGDIVDYKANHSQENGDARILDDLIRQKEILDSAGRGGRLVLLMGNHEEQAMALYETVRFKKNFPLPGPGPVRVMKYEVFENRVCHEKENWKDFDDEAKRGSLLAFVKQFDFGERMTQAHYDFLSRFKMAALCENGVFITHASYPRISSGNPGYEMLWEREGDGDDFLQKTGNELIVNEHSFPVLFGSRFKGVYDPSRKMAHVDGDRIIIAPSHHGGGGGTYLKLDLSKQYASEKDLNAGQEVLAL